MKAIVCVKQVPDTSGVVAVKEDGTMDRAKMATITNHDDLAAVEAALELKDETGCEVIVVSMGPPPAEGMLRELLAMGADRGVLVSARERKSLFKFWIHLISIYDRLVFSNQINTEKVGNIVTLRIG